jgi:hypothetical protein
MTAAVLNELQSVSPNPLAFMHSVKLPSSEYSWTVLEVVCRPVGSVLPQRDAVASHERPELHRLSSFDGSGASLSNQTSEDFASGSNRGISAHFSEWSHDHSGED